MRSRWIFLVAFLAGLLLLVVLAQGADLTIPPQGKLVNETLFGCTQPFYPEMYLDQYALGTDPTDTTLNIFGLVVADLETRAPLKDVPLVWVFFEEGSQGKAREIYVTLPGTQPVKMTPTELKATYGPTACGLFEYLQNTKKTGV